jgi:topoisomerase IA-like protein
MAVKKWVAEVDTESTYPEEGLFTQDAETIAKHLASKKVSPKGPASGMRMLNYYINRGGKNLPKERHAELEKAKGILSQLIAEEKEKAAPKKHTKRTVTAKRTAAKTAKTATTPRATTTARTARTRSAKTPARKGAMATRARKS